MVGLVEQYIGAKVNDVRYQDLSFLDGLIASGFGGPGQSKAVLRSVQDALITAWEGKCCASTTSKAVLEIAAPRRTPAEMLKIQLGE